MSIPTYIDELGEVTYASNDEKPVPVLIAGTVRLVRHCYPGIVAIYQFCDRVEAGKSHRSQLTGGGTYE